MATAVGGGGFKNTAGSSLDDPANILEQTAVNNSSSNHSVTNNNAMGSAHHQRSGTLEPTTRGGTAQASSLMDRLRVRHVDRIKTFQHTMRTLSDELDVAVVAYLSNLQSEITASRDQSQALVEALASSVQEHRRMLDTQHRHQGRAFPMAPARPAITAAAATSPPRPVSGSLTTNPSLRPGKADTPTKQSAGKNMQAQLASLYPGNEAAAHPVGRIALVTPLVDCIHPAIPALHTQGGTKSSSTKGALDDSNTAATAGGYWYVLKKRQKLCATRRQEFLQLARDLTLSHTNRMGRFQTAQLKLSQWEHSRQSTLKNLLQQLLDDLSSTAYVSGTESQLLVQRATLSVNEQLCDNDAVAQELLSRLRQHEVLSHRDRLVRVASLYQENLQLMCQSVGLWSRQLLCSKFFRDPHTRAATLAAAETSRWQQDKDVKNLLDGLLELVDSLARAPEDGTPTSPGAARPSEVPNGAVDAGWLRYFNRTPGALPVFSEGPDKLVSQWELSVDVILRNVEKEGERILKQAKQHQESLKQQVMEVMVAMVKDIRAACQPNAEDISLAIEATESMSDTSGHNQQQRFYPLHEIVEAAYQPDMSGPSVDDADTDALVLQPEPGQRKSPSWAHDVCKAALTDMTALGADIAGEAQLFTDGLGLQYHYHSTRLMLAFVRARGGLVPILRDSTAALYRTANAVASLVRGHTKDHDAIENSFADELMRLEESYQIAEDHLAHAGTPEAARDCFSEGQQLLSNTEAAYCANHEKRTKACNSFTVEVGRVLETVTQQHFDDLLVVPYEKLQAAISEERSAVAALKPPTPDTPNGPSRHSSKKAISNNGKNAKGGALSSKDKDKETTSTKSSVKLSTAQQRASTPPGPKLSEGTKRILQLLSDVGVSPANWERLPVLTIPRPSGRGREKYVVLHRGVKYGAAHEEGKVVNIPTGAPVFAPASSVVPQQIAADGGVVPTNAQEGAARQQLLKMPLAPVAFKPAQEAFCIALGSQLQSIFTEESLIADTFRSMFVNKIRDTLLSWLLGYRDNALACGDLLKQDQLSDIEAKTNEYIRRHTRRAPTLQQVFEQRVQELEDARSQRSNYFGVLRERATSAHNSAQDMLTMIDAPVEQALQKLYQYRMKLPSLGNLLSVESNQRRYRQLSATLVSELEENSTHLLFALSANNETVEKEVVAFRQDRLATFQEGGNISESEKEEAVAACQSILKKLMSTKVEFAAKVEEVKRKYLSQLEEEQRLYDIAFSQNIDELTFFKKMQEQLSSCAGKVTHCIHGSNTQAQRLEELLNELEQQVGTTVTVLAKDLPSSIVRLQTPSKGGDTDKALPCEDASEERPQVRVDEGTWEGIDAALTERLRQSEHDTENHLRTGSLHKLLSTLDTYRCHLLQRGVFLGCLVYGADLTYIPHDSYFDMAVASEVAVGPATGGSEGLNATVNGEKDSLLTKEAGKPSVASLSDEAKTITAVFNTESCVASVKREIHPVVQSLHSLIEEYFTERPNLLRSNTFNGTTKEKVIADVDSRIAALETKVRDHVEAGLRVYREVVQRTHIIGHKLGQEFFCRFARFQFASLSRRCQDAADVFAAFHHSTSHAKKRALGLLKGSMAAPTETRGQLRALVDMESKRQGAVVLMIKKVWGAFMRELQYEGTRAALRGSQSLVTLFTMLRSLVLPEHLVPGEKVNVGKHLGLKKLLRLRQRDEAFAKEETLPPTEPSPAPTTNKKEQAAKGKAQKESAAKKGVKGKADQSKTSKDTATGNAAKDGASTSDGMDDARDGDMVGGIRGGIQLGSLPPLPQKTQLYNGLAVNPVPVFDSWQEAPSALTIPEHYPVTALMKYASSASINKPKEVAPPVSPSKAGKGAVGKAPKGGGAQGGSKGGGAKGGKAGAGTNANPAGDGIDLHSPFDALIEGGQTKAVTGAQDRMRHLAWLHRQLNIEAFNGIIQRSGETVNKFMLNVLQSELAWAKEWDVATHSLS